MRLRRLLSRCSTLNQLKSIHSLILKSGILDDFVRNSLIDLYAKSCHLPAALRLLHDPQHPPDTVAFNTLINSYSKSGDLAAAHKLFDEMPHRDPVSWGTLISAYSRASQHHNALAVFDSMLANNSPPDAVALVSALRSCAHLGALDRGSAIHRYIVETNFPLTVHISTGLVDMYAKCGCLDTAREVFESSPKRNVFTWNAIIVGLAVNGHGESSLDYFERMVDERIRPDGVSFLGVLVGCSHSGLVDTARKLFDEMVTVHGVKRELKHYGCMADLLGRAGLVDEAMKMIEKMPMEGDKYVWSGVLAGCRVQGNVSVAEIASRHLLEFNPEDRGVYSIMASIYAAARRWEDVARMRLMADQGGRKNVGCSSIQMISR